MYEPPDIAHLKVLCMVDFSLAPDALDYLRQNVEVDLRKPDHATLVEAIGTCDALWIHLDELLDKDVLDRAPRLKVVCTATTGTDHIDKDELARRDIPLLSLAKDYGLLNQFTATAECAVMLMLACARRLRVALSSVLDGQWKREALFGSQLCGHTLGIVGLGRLGTITARIALGLGMRVLADDPLHDRHVDGVTRVDFLTLLQESEFVSLHVHANPSTDNLMDAKAFTHIRPGSILVNTSRGDLIDEYALIEALDSGRLAAFGADVIKGEWAADIRSSPLVRYAQAHSNVVITPHIGGATLDTISPARVFMARKLVHFLRTGEELVL